MKRNLLIIVMILCLLTVLVLPAYAANGYMVDQAGLLTEEEAADLEGTLSEISNRQGVDVVVVTVNSTNGKTPMAFADDYYDYNGYRTDGVLLLVSMEESDWWISTAGYGITAFTDAGIEYIGEQVVYYLSDGEFAQAFAEFAQRCDAFITQAKTGEPYDVDNMPKEPFAPVITLIICLVIGLIAAWIATGSMKSKLKSVRQQTKADRYVAPGSMHLTHSRDLLLYTHLDRREKPQSSSSSSGGGGSTTHTSSSGTTHGGGGGKF